MDAAGSAKGTQKVRDFDEWKGGKSYGTLISPFIGSCDRERRNRTFQPIDERPPFSLSLT